MNLQRLQSEFERFKRWVRQSPTFLITSEKKHLCQCCGQRYRGNYCPRCSQKAEVGRITWRSVRNGIMDVWGLGSRSMPLSIWQLLYRPGYFIGDYISGKRQLSFPPVKMLFIVALIYANVYFWFFPEVLRLPLEEQGAVGYKLWIREHYSWAMLVMSVLAIIPTWVVFRYSPRNTRHTIPEGFLVSSSKCCSKRSPSCYHYWQYRLILPNPNTALPLTTCWLWAIISSGISNYSVMGYGGPCGAKLWLLSVLFFPLCYWSGYSSPRWWTPLWKRWT